ncbi:uncharacterized protein LOC127804987 [Diospyros lotus]|uniref:uncharacterized protein LOC127804987 n=1 Tax=Diospyros lotus TaxID=55363 RepID=UPI0022526E05|nr:uncharacterized protein LOC127804987 [Diospyros lotus]
MHCLAMRSNFVETGQETTSKLGFQRSDLLVCPKPRHLASAIPEFLKPLSQLNTDTDEKREVLNLTAEKAVDGRDSPFTIYAGSPPGRTGNPLIHDVRFIRQMEVFSPFTRTKLSDKFGVTSASPF